MPWICLAKGGSSYTDFLQGDVGRCFSSVMLNIEYKGGSENSFSLIEQTMPFYFDSFFYSSISSVSAA